MKRKKKKSLFFLVENEVLSNVTGKEKTRTRSRVAWGGSRCGGRIAAATVATRVAPACRCSSTVNLDGARTGWPDTIRDVGILLTQPVVATCTLICVSIEMTQWNGVEWSSRGSFTLEKKI